VSKYQLSKDSGILASLLFLYTDCTKPGNFQSITVIIKGIIVILTLYYVNVCTACDEITGYRHATLFVNTIRMRSLVNHLM